MTSSGQAHVVLNLQTCVVSAIATCAEMVIELTGMQAVAEPAHC